MYLLVAFKLNFNFIFLVSPGTFLPLILAPNHEEGSGILHLSSLFSFVCMHITLIPPLYSILTLPLTFENSSENFELFPQI